MPWNTILPAGTPGSTDETVNRGNVVLIGFIVIGFFVAREPNVGGDPAEGDKVSTGVKVANEALYFQNH